MNTLLTTDTYGNPHEWPRSAGTITQTAWDIAHEQGIDLFSYDMAYRHGIEVTGLELMLGCIDTAPRMEFVAGMLYLIKHGVIETPIAHDWDGLLISRHFIEAQQAAHQSRVIFTNKLADLSLKAYTYYHAHLQTGIVCRCALVAQAQYLRIQGMMKRALRDGLLDNKVWGQRIEASPDTIKAPEYAEIH